MIRKIRDLILYSLVGVQLISCATIPAKSAKTTHASVKTSTHRVINQTESDNQALFRKLLNEQKTTDSPSVLVLETAQSMLNKGTIVQGSCWDYITHVFEKAGFSGKHVSNVYWQKMAGPYVDVQQIQMGDWVMFRNFSYYKIDHSAIFIAWVDQNANIALTISYVGQDRRVPGRLYQYDLSECFGIRRAQ